MSYTAGVITVSDKGSRGQRADTSGPAVCEMLRQAGYEVVYTNIVPDDLETIKGELLSCADEKRLDLVLTTGGTGFSPRDVTPEATLAVVEREARGIPEAMRAESMRVTPRGCLSRSAAGIRSGTLIVNLPGSEKAARENLQAVLPALDHGLKMLASAGSADCAAPEEKETPPSLDAWLREAKRDPSAGRIGMYLVHSGVVRETSRAQVREGKTGESPVTAMEFSYDPEKAAAAVADTYRMEGVYYIRVWLNRGRLRVGDDIMRVLVGGDIRPHVVDALQYLVGRLKTECVTERELSGGPDGDRP